MEKVKLSICGHDFSLKTENPAKLEMVAADLSARIKKVKEMGVTMSFTDIVMLVALDIAETNFNNAQIIGKAEDDANKVKEIEDKASEEAKKAKEEISKLEAELAELKVSLSQSQDELRALKAQYAAVDPDAEVKLIEENRVLSNEVKTLSDKNKELGEELERIKSEYKNTLDNTDTQISSEEVEQLRTTVATYEKTFDEYATQRNAEVKALNEELNVLRRKYADLSTQMNEIVNDGQLTL